MSCPGTKSPPCVFPKTNDRDGDNDGSKLPLALSAKQIKYQTLGFTDGRVSDIGTAPTSRVYTRDYSKVGREPDDVDLVSSALGNPVFRI